MLLIKMVKVWWPTKKSSAAHRLRNNTQEGQIYFKIKELYSLAAPSAPAHRTPVGKHCTSNMPMSKLREKVKKIVFCVQWELETEKYTNKKLLAHCFSPKNEQKSFGFRNKVDNYSEFYN